VEREYLGLANQGGDHPRVIVSASIAYDLIMTFPGSFEDYVLADKAHVLSVSFLFDSLRRNRGGVGGNIAYSLALLGERPLLVGAVGPDFVDYHAACEAVGIDTSLVVEVPDLLTGSSFMMSDRTGNQIAGFYPGAGERADEISVADVAKHAVFGHVSATTLGAMRRHAQEIADAGARLIFDPSQQVVAMPAEDIVAGVERAWAVIGSDYEHAIMTNKTGVTVEQLVAKVPLVVVTFGGAGSHIYYEGTKYEIPVAPADPLVEVTGGGDAYRAGLIKSMLLGLEWPAAGRVAALAATYAIERHGTQEHQYTPEAFVERFDAVFPDFVGVIHADQLRQEAIITT
jgi:adenosine kinase